MLYFTKEMEEFMEAFDGWFKKHPYAGFFAFSLSYFIWVPIMLPSSIMTMFGGFIFAQYYGKVLGFFICIAAIWLTHPIAALLTFLMARYFLRGFITENVINKVRVFKAIDRSFETQGLKLMILLKVQPIIPWNIMNYILSVTSCSATNFFIGTFIGITPKTLTCIYLGLNIQSISELVVGKKSLNAVEITFMVISLIAFVVVMYLITRESKR